MPQPVRGGRLDGMEQHTDIPTGATPAEFAATSSTDASPPGRCRMPQPGGTDSGRCRVGFRPLPGPATRMPAGAGGYAAAVSAVRAPIASRATCSARSHAAGSSAAGTGRLRA